MVGLHIGRVEAQFLPAGKARAEVAGNPARFQTHRVGLAVDGGEQRLLLVRDGRRHRFAALIEGAKPEVLVIPFVEAPDGLLHKPAADGDAVFQRVGAHTAAEILPARVGEGKLDVHADLVIRQPQRFLHAAGGGVERVDVIALGEHIVQELQPVAPVCVRLLDVVHRAHIAARRRAALQGEEVDRVVHRVGDFAFAVDVGDVRHQVGGGVEDVAFGILHRLVPVPAVDDDAVFRRVAGAEIAEVGLRRLERAAGGGDGVLGGRVDGEAAGEYMNLALEIKAYIARGKSLPAGGFKYGNRYVLRGGRDLRVHGERAAVGDAVGRDEQLDAARRVHARGPVLQEGGGEPADFADLPQIVDQLPRAAAVKAHPARVADRFGCGAAAGERRQVFVRAVLEREAVRDRLAGCNGRAKPADEVCIRHNV